MYITPFSLSLLFYTAVLTLSTKYQPNSIAMLVGGFCYSVKQTVPEEFTIAIFPHHPFVKV